MTNSTSIMRCNLCGSYMMMELKQTARGIYYPEYKCTNPSCRNIISNKPADIVYDCKSTSTVFTNRD